VFIVHSEQNRRARAARFCAKQRETQKRAKNQKKGLQSVFVRGIV